MAEWCGFLPMSADWCPSFVKKPKEGLSDGSQSLQERLMAPSVRQDVVPQHLSIVAFHSKWKLALKSPFPAGCCLDSSSSVWVFTVGRVENSGQCMCTKYLYVLTCFCLPLRCLLSCGIHAVPDVFTPCSDWLEFQKHFSCREARMSRGFFLSSLFCWQKLAACVF